MNHSLTHTPSVGTQIRTFLIVAGLATAFTIAAQPQQTQAAEQTIVEIAAGSEDFSTLVSLVSSAGLVDTLNSEGPFTVFAPTNDAFAKLPPRIVDIIVNNPDILSSILTYHVVAGSLEASDVLAQRSIQTVQGRSLRVSTFDGNAYVDRSQIVATDIQASNGIVHVIDSVLIPHDARIAILRAAVQQYRADMQQRAQQARADWRH